MADNFTFTQGSGATGAADDIGGVLYPRVKIAQGADGSATDVSSAAPLQVTLANTGANSTAVKVDNSAVTQPISAASLPLPSGAATTAKQPALGTAGTASADVITIQGIASMTAVKVDGSAVTQPVSGTVTASISSSTNAGATAKTTDYDTGGGTDTVTMFGIALPASGGAVAGGTSTNPIQVSVANTAANATAIKVDGSAVTQPVSISGNQAANITQIGGNSISTGNGTSGTGTVRVAIASDNTANTNPFLTTQTPATSGGLSIYSGTIGATATAVKASAGQVYGWYVYNTNASAAYVQFFNVASGSVTLGTTSPTFSLGIPASSGANVSFESGIAMGTAITVAVTTTRSGSTGPGSTVDLNIFYK